LLIEEQEGYKISLRSKESIDVAEIAFTMGGGGHKRAAGFNVQHKNTKKILDDILQKVHL